MISVQSSSLILTFPVRRTMDSSRWSRGFASYHRDLTQTESRPDGRWNKAIRSSKLNHSNQTDFPAPIRARTVLRPGFRWVRLKAGCPPATFHRPSGRKRPFHNDEDGVPAEPVLFPLTNWSSTKTCGNVCAFLHIGHANFLREHDSIPLPQTECDTTDEIYSFFPV